MYVRYHGELQDAYFISLTKGDADLLEWSIKNVQHRLGDGVSDSVLDWLLLKLMEVKKSVGQA